MSTSYRAYTPHQDLLLPPSLKDWLPEDHLAWFISDAVDALDLSAFYARYEGDGRRRQPYEPSMMIKVLVYAYASGVFSSRKIAKRLEEDIAFRVLAAGNFPAHRTLRAFRQRHLAEFSELFVQIVRLARESGLVKLGRVGIDGTKVKANASKHKAMSYKRMKQREQELEAQIKELARRAEAQDEAEDAEYGVDCRGDEIPEELRRREQRLEAIRAAKARLEARQKEEDEQEGRHLDEDGNTRGPGGGRCKRALGEVPDNKQDNFTDPESRIMKTGYGFDQCYNAQAAVDGQSLLIIATELGNNGNDNDRLLSVLEGVQANTGSLPEMSLADAGYAGEVNFAALQEREIAACISLAQRDGQLPKRDPDKYPATHRMAEHMATAEAKEHYRHRKMIPEPVFGWIKQAMGFRSFSLRGLEKATGEWNLVCLATNLRRMHRMGWQPA